MKGTKLTKLSFTDLDYICKLQFDIFNVPISFIDHTGKSVINYADNEQTNPSVLKNTFIQQKILTTENKFVPVIWESELYENFASQQVKLENNTVGNIIIGPMLYTQLSDESIIGLFNDMKIQSSKEKFIGYCESIAVLSKWDLTNLLQTIYFMVWENKLLIEEINLQRHTLNHTTMNLDQAEIQLAKRRQNLISYADLMTEKKVIDCIKSGKKNELENIFMKGIKTGQMGLLDKTSHLRSQKNLAIVGIAIGTRAAIDGGLHPEIAYTLSDLFIQHVEELTDSKLVMQFLKKAFLEFTDRVEKSNKQNFTKTIHLCVNYIFSNLYEELSLETLAEVSKVSPSYLSALFKKEVGISLSAYIQRAKIDESINLMTYTDYSLLVISSLLNYHDQSYFTKVFKKHTGVTPNQYKNGQKK